MLAEREDNRIDHLLWDLLYEQICFAVAFRLLQDLLPVRCGG